MEANEKSLFNEVTSEESATVSGGTSVNFDLNTYLFTIGAGAIFDGGLTTNVRDLAFRQALSSTTTPAAAAGAAAGAAATPAATSAVGGFPPQGGTNSNL